MSLDPRDRHDVLLRGIVSRLIGEFGDMFTDETLEHHVHDSYVQLSGRAKVRTHIPSFVERFARERMRALAKQQGLVTDHPPVVLFVCGRNDAASQMAASLFERFAGDRGVAMSAGPRPAAALLDEAVEVMHEIDVDLLGGFPKPLTPEVETAADVVVTLDAHDEIEVVDDTQYRAWRLPAYDLDDLDGCRALRDELITRVRELVHEVVPPASPPSRGAFDQDLETIDRQLRELLDLSLDLQGRAARVLRRGESETVEQLDAADDVVDRAWVELEKAVVVAIARHQPVANDLRDLIATMQAGLHLERIADGAVDLATAMDQPGLLLDDAVLAHLAAMADLVAVMAEEAVTALVERDLERANGVGGLDTDLDALHGQTLEYLIDGRPADIDGELLVQVDRASRSLERAGDHAVDIAEAARYLVTGEFEELDVA